MGVKLKFPGKGKPKPKQAKQGMRKKRKVESSEDDTLTPLSSEEEEEEDAEEEAKNENPYGAGPSQPSSRRSRRQTLATSQPPSNPQGLFDDDDNVELVQSVSLGGGDPPRSRSPSPQPTRAKRGKRKATAAVLTSDDEEGMGTSYVDDGARNDDADEDFVMNSPPRKTASGTKRGGTTGRGRGRGGRARGGASEPLIKVKDERRADSGTLPGLKRRRDSAVTITNDSMGVDAGAGPSQSTAESSSITQPPPRKLSKLPSMRKKPGLGTPTPGTSGTELGLARKPAAAKTQQTADLDLSSKDVYNSLFKGNGMASAPRAGVNTRVKEEERKKELRKLRDEARAARMAALQKSTFDLARGQERIAAFEEELRARNSPALYPNHLGSSIKFYYLEQQKFNGNSTILTGGGEGAG